MATFKHISSKNADYGAAEQYLTFEHDEFTMKPTLDENGRLMLREDYRIATLNCGDEDFAVACIQNVAISGDAINSIWGIVGYTVLLCFSLFKTSSVTKSVLGAH